MVAKKIIFLLLASFSLAACYDKAAGPKIQNGLTESIVVEVQFSDSSTYTAIFPPCRISYIGHPEKNIERFIVKLDDRVLHDIDKVKIREIIDKSSTVVDVWSIYTEDLKPQKASHCER